jgi:hypothetical protein
MIGDMWPVIISVQNVAHFWMDSDREYGRFFFKLSRRMSTKRNRSSVPPGGKMAISTIPIAVEHTQNIAFCAPISGLGRIGRLTSALTHTADLGASK